MTEGRIDNDGWFLAELFRPFGFDRALGIIFLAIMFRVIFEFISNALQNSSNCDHACHTFMDVYASAAFEQINVVRAEMYDRRFYQPNYGSLIVPKR